MSLALPPVLPAFLGGLDLLRPSSRQALAAVVPWMDLEDLAGAAEVIALGTVESADGAWSEDGRIIVTHVTLEVERSLKGGPRSRIVFRVPGGSVDGQTMIASGAPVFRKGERVVVFLQGPRLGIVGWNLGRFAVRRDPHSGRDVVDDRTDGALYVDAHGAPLASRRAGAGQRALGAFLDEVERLVAPRGRP